MDSIIEAKLKQCLRIRQYAHFYRPDNFSPPYDSCQPPLKFDRLLFVLSGEKEEQMSLDGKLQTVTLTGSDAYLIDKHVWEYGNMTQPHELLCIVLRGAYLRVSYYNIAEKRKRSAPFPQARFHHTNVPPCDAIIHVIQALKTTYPTAVNSLIHATLSLTLSECKKSVSLLKKSHMTYEHILNFIDLNFVSDLTRDSVATTFGLSPAYISQLFHNIAGMTFSDYLCSCRINYAKQLLLNTRHPIKQIAVLCGYKDEVYFVRRFREIVGIPPGAYRNQCKQDT